MGDLIEQGVDGDGRADREGGLVDPLAGLGGDGPGAEQDPAVGVGEQPEVPARVSLVGPRPGEGLGEVDLDCSGAQALLVGLGPGEPGGGDLGVGEDDAGDAVVAGGVRPS